MERPLIAHELGELLGHRDVWLPVPRRAHLQTQLLGLERLEVLVDAIEVPHRRDAARHDDRRRRPREVHGVLQRHERAVGMPEHRVSIELHRASEHHDVLRVPFERPGVFGGSLRPAARTLIDEHEPDAALGQGVEVVAELVMVETRTAVQHEQRQAVVGSALDEPERRVVDRDEPSVAHSPEPHVSRPVIRKPPSRTL